MHLLHRYFEIHPNVPRGIADSQLQDARNFNVLALATALESHHAEDETAAELDAVLAKRRVFVRLAKYLSPAVLAQESWADLAGTGTDAVLEFRLHAKNFSERWQAYCVPLILGGQMMRVGDYDAIPRFVQGAQRRSPTAEILRACAAIFLMAGVGLGACP